MMRCVRFFTVCVFVFVGLSAMTAAMAQSGEFSVRAVIPENQIDKRQTYFDLAVEPGQRQRLELIIKNSRDTELEASIALCDASTGRNGLIVYNAQNARDELLELGVTDVAALDTQLVKVPAHGEAVVGLELTIPDEPFKGVVLGGISVTGNVIEDEQSSGVTLKNVITYVTALKLTESDAEIEPNFGLRSVTPKLVNYKTAVAVNMENRAARIVKGVKIDASVYKRGSDTVIGELALNRAEFAPLSSGELVIDWGNRPLDQGNYRLRMTAEYLGKTWQWDEEFEITGDAKQINDDAIGLIKDYRWLQITAGAAVFTLIWLAAYRSGRRRRRNPNQA